VTANPFLYPLFAIAFVIVAGVVFRKTGQWDRERTRAVVGIVIFLALVDIAIVWWRGQR
jgi:hypothetical protein